MRNALNRRVFFGWMSMPATAAISGVLFEPARMGRALAMAGELEAHPGAPSAIAEDEDY